jgi:hypothetical protein
MMDCQPRSCRRILDEARIHKYTHTNHELSTMNIKYYNFGSCFYTTEFCSRKVHIDAEVIHSTIQGQHLTLRCCPQKWSTPIGSPNMGPTVEYGPLTSDLPWHHRRERRTTCTQLGQQGEAWATKSQQDWPVNVATNNWLLDMQGTMF